MENSKYKRREKVEKPVLAICYDFDKTLTPIDMQAQGYIQAVGYENVDDFWTKSNRLAEGNDMDQISAYMLAMLEESHGTLLFKRETLQDYGAKVTFFPGVESWFERIKEFGLEHGVIVEHYVISCGLKEMIEGTSIAKNGAFEEIYASSFYYDERGVAKWPAQVVNYTNKTQFLFRISKGVLEVNDIGVNDFFAPEDVRVPFRNMVYIGDSDTDIPCMKLVNINGGHSIGVYNYITKDKSKVYKMMRDNRIKYFAAADYTAGSELDALIKSIIVRTAANEVLESIHYNCKKEYFEADKNTSEPTKRKTDLINALENSWNFARTHSLIRELKEFESWTDAEKEKLFEIALSNNQVFYILRDGDVRSFYEAVLNGIENPSENAQKVKSALAKAA